LMMMLISACMLASMHFSSGLQASAGGLLGRTLSEVTLSGLELVGSTLLALTLLFLGLTLGLGISWLKTVDTIGFWSLRLFGFATEWLVRWQERRREEAETRELINHRK